MSAPHPSSRRAGPRASGRRIHDGAGIARRRHGRLLVECLVAMLLVAIGATLLAGTTKAVALLADDAALVARSQAEASAAAESLYVIACTGVPGSRLTDRARVALAVSAARSGAMQRTSVIVTPRATPLAGRTMPPLALSAGRACP